MFPIRPAHLAFAATTLVAFTLLLLLSPTAGAQVRREQRDASTEETPVVLQVVTVPEERTDESEPPDSVVIETSEPDPPCPEGWAPAEPPLNPDLGCLPQNAAAESGSGDGGGEIEAQVAVEANNTGDVIATDDLAVANGTITIEVRWCPNGGNGIDYTTVSLPELMDACQEPGYAVDFTLDLGYWSGAQTVGDVLPGGIYWEPPQSPDPIAIYGPAGGSFDHKVYCDPDYDGVAKPDYGEVSVVGGAIGAVLSPSTARLHCAWFLTPFIAGIVAEDAETADVAVGGDGGQITDLAVESGSITILVEWCPSGLDDSVDKFNELIDACQEPDQDVAFGLFRFRVSDSGSWLIATFLPGQRTGDVIPNGVFWTLPLSSDSYRVGNPDVSTQAIFCDDDYDGDGNPKYDQVSGPADPPTSLFDVVLSPETDAFYCTWFLVEGDGFELADEDLVAYTGATGTSTDGTATLAIPPRPEEHPGHCPEGYSYELLLHEDERGNLTWLYGCVPDGSGSPTGPDDIESAGGRPESPPGNACPNGYSWKLLLRENADGSLTWLYGCVPDGSGDPTGPDDIGTGGDGGRGDSPRIVTAHRDQPDTGGGGTDPDLPGTGGDGSVKCPDGHHWTDGPIHFPDWLPNPLTVYGGCVPDSGECPDGYAIHPAYTEYGCLKYGTGPWTP